MLPTVRLQLLGFIVLGISVISTLNSASAAMGQCVRAEVTDRPKIGLVLGGGGARGYAHVGVLKKLEEMRIPYDYIAGTSMGSIAGGFVATGMESEEIAKVVRETDWDDMFKDETNREDIPFRRKEDDDLGLYGPKLGIGKNSELLPSGVVSGQKVIFMFESVTSQRVQTSDFDELPIPFRAIATDIVTGSMVVIADGELSLAMRASMAVPGVFDPIHRDGALLVDGGLTRNLPVDVARDMGADIVIAIDVGTKLAAEDEITNALAVVLQMSGLLTVGNTNIQIESLGKGDILITPELGDTIGSADFKKLDEAIPLGYAATEAVQDQLQKYSLSEKDYLAWRQQIEGCVDGKPQVHFVQLDNQSRFSDDVILEVITIESGDLLDLEQMDYDLKQIYGLGFIRQASYHVVNQDGQTGVIISVHQDERGTQFLETGLDLTFSGRGTEFSVRAAYLNTGLDDRGSEFRAMAQLGESPGLFVDYFRPLDDGLKYSFNPSFSLFSRPILIFDDKGHSLAEIELDEVGAAIAFSREFNRHAKVSAGYTRYFGSMDTTIGNPQFPPFDFDGAESFIELDIDKLDDRYLPRRGYLASFRYTNSSESLGADLRFNQFESAFLSSHTVGLHNFIWGGQYNISLDENQAIYSWYSAGGFLNMSGFEPNSLVGEHYGMVLGGYRYQIGKSGLLPGYVGMTLEYGNATRKRSDILSDGLLNGSVYLAYSSPLGPIYFGVGLSEQRSALYFLRLGTIFGPRRLGRR